MCDRPSVPCALLLVACAHPPTTPAITAPAPVPDAVAWLPASALAERLASGELTSDGVRDAALARIDALDRQGPGLRALIATDPGAAPATSAGRLWGLPVVVKDNVDVVGFATTAGSLALADNQPADDAFVIARLREAGAVLLGKANLSEWANFRAEHSSSGWSAVGGQARNPHALDRSPCGSSSGSASAVAAGYAPFAVGTETDGSILCPAAMNGVVGVKPTLGLVSRDGIVPIAHSQDTAGPIGRTVADAALLLEVMAAADPADPATASRPADLDVRYTDGLSVDALRGARIGVARELGAFGPKVSPVFDAALADLTRLGAELVEVDVALDPSVDVHELEVLLHEFQPDLEGYLAGSAAAGVGGLAGLVAFDEAHAADEMPWFRQELFDQALAHRSVAHGAADPDPYTAAVAALAKVGPDNIDAVLAGADGARLDALVAPTVGPAWPIDLVNGDAFTGGTTTITAVSGYPAVTVPMGEVHGLPLGMSLIGGRFTEGRLLALAYAYEQGTHHQRIPDLAPTVPAR